MWKVIFLLFIFCSIFGFIEVNGAGTTCDASQWPDLDRNIVCGDCKALIDKMKTKYETCKNYCKTIGRSCVGAWEDVDDDCEVKSTENCTHLFNYTSDAICECGNTTECLKEDNISYDGNNIDQKKVSGVDECISWCGEVNKCKFWTFHTDHTDNNCFIKDSNTGRKEDETGVSGTKGCAFTFDKTLTTTTTAPVSTTTTAPVSTTTTAPVSTTTTAPVSTTTTAPVSTTNSQDCLKEYNISYSGNNINQTRISGVDECIDWCGEVKNCTYWSYYTNHTSDEDDNCYIKYSDAGRMVDETGVSGTKGCASTTEKNLAKTTAAPVSTTNPQDCDKNGSKNEDEICVCNSGYAGNGFICGYDKDSDGFPDNTLDCIDPSCQKDNCPEFPNSGQEDADGDGQGDSCDEDSDNDKVLNKNDNCQLIENVDQNDKDGDDVGDVCDNCPDVRNVNQEDMDDDGLGDMCDPDIDNDGIDNEDDNCRFDDSSDQSDVDNDGIGDVCDNCPKLSNPNQDDKNKNSIGDACDGGEDKDEDGVPDNLDNCPKLSNSDQLDTDKDELGDLCDPDKDGDGIDNTDDNCSLVSNDDQSDNDEDGQGNDCDDDDDGDGILDKEDNCPKNKEVQITDFRASKSIDLCVTDCGEIQDSPKWDFRDEGKEIWQGINSRAGVTIGKDKLSAVDFKGTIFVDTENDNDFVGFIFSYQDTSNFYVVYSSKQSKVTTQGPWRITRVASITGPSKELNKALWKTESVEGQTKILWTDPDDNGWKSKTPYQFFLQHRPQNKTVRLQIHEGSKELFDTGNLETFGKANLAGGKVGVFCLSQEKVIWSSLSYTCIQE